ncbi:MAG: hypothetical protein A3H27_17665 [Acidobacteria bacterium RIFCSPLOWO2_02_FULL_59_13]|nr:MAG: hypothetical protein A3H27_17665 [Acidobacteria bacterium RIFCSPLOWO2_02_FULL_59_13]
MRNGAAVNGEQGAATWRRIAAVPHRSLRRILFRPAFLVQGLAVAILLNFFLVRMLSSVWLAHSRIVEALLQWSGVPWAIGRWAEIWPGSSAPLLRTPFLDYQIHPYYPWLFLGLTTILFLIGFRRWPAPWKPLLFSLPLSLGITLFYLKAVSPALPYSSEDFCALWYRGETYLWLLLPWIWLLGFFLLNVPLWMKLFWLALLGFYSFLWSAVRLATALATFYYLGPLWMLFFYFAFGFLADFLYIVAFYSLAVDRAAVRLYRQKEAWG